MEAPVSSSPFADTMSLEEIIEGTMQRVLKTFCEGFEVWWARIPEARRVLLLDQAVGDNPHFTIQSRSLIERSVRDTTAICNLLSVIGADFGQIGRAHV